MENTFYITEKDTPQGKWYNLRVLPTHFCLSAGDDLNKIGEVIKRYVREFSGEADLMLRSFSHLSSGGKVSEAAFEQYENWYKEHGNDYKDFVVSCINGVSAERKAKFKRKFSPKKKILGNNFSDNEVSEASVIEETPAPVLKARFKFKNKVRKKTV